jgi:acid phosphatase class B
MKTATASIGLAAQRGDRLSYFLGTRYIGEINSTIASLAANYELSLKYSVQFNQAVDLGERENRATSVAVVRRFDRYFVRVNVYYDSASDESGVNFAVYPQDLGLGFGPGEFQAMFQR